MQTRCARSSSVQIDIWDPAGSIGQSEWVQVLHPEGASFALLRDGRGLIDSSLWVWLVKKVRHHRKLRVVGGKH